MKHTSLAVIMAIASGLTGMAPRANAAGGDSITFNLRVSAGAAACIATNAFGRVNISDLGAVQNMHVEMFHLPPKTEFAAFVLQVPKSPFGLAWYQGDILTNADGKGVGDFTGIFNRETFILASGPTMHPVILPLVQSKSITWEFGSRMQPKQATLVAQTRLLHLMATIRPASRC